ncbi:glycosyltransferase family 4 protein [Streptococcus mitis]|uniref:glycosyltransferase family 4 protein n=1 Tax=Streptococcus mitis TaxID=28037 RepID=UPI0020015CD1|nr:glycosyltransferase [Streptococcus mitis]
MVKVFTIKEVVPVSSYGFERSQLARQEIFKSLEVEQELVLTNLEHFVPNFVETLENLGFEDFHHVIYDQSDLARQKPSVKKDFIEELKGVVRVESTNEGYVGLIRYQDGSVECYTSQLLYRYSHQEKLFTLYDSKGELLKGDVSENYHSYQNLRSGEIYTQWQLVSLYLANNSTVEDLFIIDMVNEYPLQLRKFFQNTGRTLFAYTHYNILDPQMKFVLQNWCQNLVASPVLEERLGSNLVRFLPPIYVKEGIEKEYTSVTDWCIVGNMTFLKRCEWAIEAFRELPDSKLTIYGNLPVGYTKEDLPDNVHFKGFVENVPYENHEGYISCSMSECFANAAVEASSFGLVCLLSDVDLAHKFYASICKNTKLFEGINDLKELILKHQYIGLFKSSKFYSCYTFDNVLKSYKDLF